jgi:cell division septation protein DedD
MDIRDCIAELLSLHDCVIIPGFGGFIGNYSPARIDMVHHTFQPPAKNLLFNINLKQNDGLLANEVASSFGISYPDACRMIDGFSDECRLTLKRGKPFIIPMVGQLFSGKEGIIYFEQDKNANLLADAFGLTPFISPPIIRDSSSLGHDWKKSNDGIERSVKGFITPRILRWAALIALPVGIAAVIGVTQYNRLSVNFANNAGILNSVFSRFSAASLFEKKDAPVLTTKAFPKAKPVKPEPLIAVTSEDQPEITPAAPASSADNQMVIRHDDRFAVIVGAFRVHENAEKLIAALQQKGIPASVFDQSKTGLYRVTIGTSSDRAAAKQLLMSAKSADFSGAWLLAK